MLGILDSSLKMVKFFMKHLRKTSQKLHDVTIVWPGQCSRDAARRSNAKRGHAHYFDFNTQHVATGWPASLNMLRPTMLLYFASKCCDPLTGTCKCWASNVGIYCAEMLRSFGRGLNCQPAFAKKKTECQMVGYKKDALIASKACDH